ncbi:MAG: Eco47II family restriction endonuclease [Clostridia bacterium]|nr:Eco47II family restriction endonuclease [Clostridia bacterium]
MWDLSFISEQDFKKHVQLTIQQYGEKLVPYDMNRFNSNIVDPIKLIFDKTVYRYSWEEIINNEIFRQRDKSNNNDIGYFHQRIFQYMSGCVVPKSGWDVILTKDNGIMLPDGDKVKTVYVEMKNKHNTMNSASSGKTYIKMQGQLLSDDDCACFLVEAIAKQSQNITWSVSVDKTKQKHRRIRRVSMDEFYYTVTGQTDAFYRMCLLLPSVIEEVIENTDAVTIPNDTVISELKSIAEKENGSFALALYMLGFGTYKGFRKEC